MKKIEMKQNLGITLVALVITIIVLLILAGVTISLTFGENGILERAEKAKEIYNEQEAREKLSLALVDLQTDKRIDNLYNKNEYVNNKLLNQEMTPVGDIIVVNEWQFQIDRDRLEIVANLGSGKQNENIKIETTQEVSSDYVNSTIKSTVIYNEGNISEITINGEVVKIEIEKNGVYNIEKVVEENGNYTIIVKDEKGNFKIETIKVEDITEDMEIWNKADMEQFRDRVNSGRTYEKRKVSVMDEINLEGTQENQWIPIGTKNTPFKGIFEGNKHTIQNIYLTKEDNIDSALFGVIEEATVQNVSVTGKIETINLGAGIVAFAKKGSTIYNCRNYVSVTQKGNSYEVEGYLKDCSSTAAGIVAFAYENVKLEKCINYGNIVSNLPAGGIIGTTYRNIIIDSCGNNGKMVGRNNYRRYNRNNWT